jgi:uncharacterized protein
MAAYTTIDLTRIAPTPGDGKRLELEVEPGSVKLGDDVYELAGPAVPARVEVSHAASGFAMRLGYAGDLEGPCMRCLEPARVTIEVESREVDQPRTDDEELRSPYVTEGELDVTAWAHDALVLALPQRILCRPDCAGLCPVCGESLNDAPEGAHDHPREPDPRWDKLRSQKID